MLDALIGPKALPGATLNAQWSLKIIDDANRKLLWIS